MSKKNVYVTEYIIWWCHYYNGDTILILQWESETLSQEEGDDSSMRKNTERLK